MPRIRKRVEDFVCARCGTAVHGTGTTNHCPVCLTSRHMDILPGDRQESCGGLMAPTAVSQDRRGWRLTHTCSRCGTVRHCRTAANDSFSAILRIAEHQRPPRIH
ncbi:MAG: RNHCP domain-containing protein [Candidatus Kerfeldbacteria bacterium]|nr:RNHCP domain-containing protein [Candidatus Kerfeldbacteria bacterium]